MTLPALAKINKTMDTAKYIITKNGDIIAFSSLIKHSAFKGTEPISAGFISFGTKDGNPVCSCYGKSTSLELESRPEEDTLIAMRWLLGYDYWMIDDMNES